MSHVTKNGGTSVLSRFVSSNCQGCVLESSLQLQGSVKDVKLKSISNLSMRARALISHSGLLVYRMCLVSQMILAETKPPARKEPGVLLTCVSPKAGDML